jgi:hypothetical protein
VILDDRIKVGVLHGLDRGQTFLVVVPQQFVEKVEGFGRDEVLVFAVHESLPTFARMTAEDVRESGIELDL